MENEFTKRILSSLLLLPIVIFIIIKGSFFFKVFLFIILVVSAYEWHTMSKYKSYNIYGLIFLFISIYCVYKLRVNIDNSYSTIIIILIICILTDIGGFIFGKILKGPKLTKYSPNKTYTGVLGSFILPLSSIPILISFNLLNENNMSIILLFFIFVSAVSQMGDIIISFYKRLSNIKDTGKIIPGHGGLLDRIDGMIFAFPFSYFLLSTSFFENLII